MFLFSFSYREKEKKTLEANKSRLQFDANQGVFGRTYPGYESVNMRGGKRSVMEVLPHNY